ncbi:siderophore-interacting protein [Corynebacterium mustelae]|uniref:Siderophore-interacting protein n=1 Tax=Corynebacterium mustelae TaxID=571915 RepID=A0A0G3GV88_9CORY|nr:siderophore-interacting protein [Corynebacterium mustelae]AKK04435.1 siderophore-interacting protein [Corynebacterium mustelae]
MYQPMRAQVSQTIRLSPNFVRIYFNGPELATLDTTMPIFDRRIKVLFPNSRGEIPEFHPLDSWYQQWQELPESLQPPMRSYSIRDIQQGETGVELVIDFVLHSKPGAQGPAGSWAEAAQVGDTVVIVGPTSPAEPEAIGEPRPGIEFQPAIASEIVLVGDETALPAIGRILEDLSAQDDTVSNVAGMVFIEVPEKADYQELRCPPGFSVQWFHRENHQEPGAQLIQAITTFLGNNVGIQKSQTPSTADKSQSTTLDGVTELVWETPTYSAAGYDITDEVQSPGRRYFWIAGESGAVTKIRRILVRDFHIPRSDVAFMGYWKIGRAMG